jgi:hypothetical protein
MALREKAKRFDEDSEIQAALVEAGVPELGLAPVGPYSRAAASALKSEQFDLGALPRVASGTTGSTSSWSSSCWGFDDGRSDLGHDPTPVLGGIQG